MRGKRVDKSERKSDLPDGRVAPGRGPAPGSPNAGRPPDAWRALCRQLASRTEMIKTAETVLKDRDHPAWLGAWKFLAEQGYGKALQQLSGPDGGPIPVQVINAPGFKADGA